MQDNTHQVSGHVPRVPVQFLIARSWIYLRAFMVRLSWPAEFLGHVLHPLLIDVVF